MEEEGLLDDRRKVRFEENGDFDPFDREQKRVPKPLNKDSKGNELPAAYQRIPERHNITHTHGPTVDQTVIDLLTYKEVSYPSELDITVLGFGICSVALAYLAFFYREQIINDEIYEKFQDQRGRYAESPGLTMIKIIPEAIKLFSLFAYNVMIILYLIRPLKTSSSEERDLTKKYNEMLKTLGNGNRDNAQAKAKLIEGIQNKRSDMLSYRYKMYNSSMNHALKEGLSLDFIISCLGMAAFFITSVLSIEPDLGKAALSTISDVLRRGAHRFCDR